MTVLGVVLFCSSINIVVAMVVVRLTFRVSDGHGPRTQAVFNDAHKTGDVKSKTAGGCSLQSMVNGHKDNFNMLSLNMLSLTGVFTTGVTFSSALAASVLTSLSTSLTASSSAAIAMALSPPTFSNATAA